jgi:hypothetical protein
VTAMVLVGAAPPTMYLPFAQEPTSGIVVIARTGERSASPLLPSLTAAIHELDRGISTFAPRTMTDIVTQSQPAYLRRSSATLVGAFAATAWLMGRARAPRGSTRAPHCAPPDVSLSYFAVRRVYARPPGACHFPHL